MRKECISAQKNILKRGRQSVAEATQTINTAARAIWYNLPSPKLHVSLPALKGIIDVSEAGHVVLPQPFEFTRLAGAPMKAFLQKDADDHDKDQPNEKQVRSYDAAATMKSLRCNDVLGWSAT
jgi:hypothetical protein